MLCDLEAKCQIKRLVQLSWQFLPEVEGIDADILELRHQATEAAVFASDNLLAKSLCSRRVRPASCAHVQVPSRRRPQAPEGRNDAEGVKPCSQVVPPE